MVRLTTEQARARPQDRAGSTPPQQSTRGGGEGSEQRFTPPGSNSLKLSEIGELTRLSGFGIGLGKLFE